MANISHANTPANGQHTPQQLALWGERLVRHARCIQEEIIAPSEFWHATPATAFSTRMRVWRGHAHSCQHAIQQVKAHVHPLFVGPDTVDHADPTHTQARKVPIMFALDTRSGQQRSRGTPVGAQHLLGHFSGLDAGGSSHEHCPGAL